MRMEIQHRLRRNDGSVIQIQQSMEPISTDSGDGEPRWFNTLAGLDYTSSSRPRPSSR